MSHARRSLATCLFALGTLLISLLALPAQAQGDRFHIGVRLGTLDLIHSSDSYDAVYGDTMTQVGIGLELRFRQHWFLSLDVDRGEVDGEQVVFLPQPVSTEIATTLEIMPIHLSFGRIFNSEANWSWYFGVGPTFVDWEESSDTGTSSSSDGGFHGLAGLRRNLNHWSLDLELLYSTVPDAFEGGAAAFFGEDDIGGVSLTLGINYGF